MQEVTDPTINGSAFGNVSVEQGQSVIVEVNFPNGFFGVQVNGTTVSMNTASTEIKSYLNVGTNTLLVLTSDINGRSESQTCTITVIATTPQTYTITTSSNPDTGGSTSGDGTFDAGTSQTVTATANSNYHFVNWTEGGNEVSTNPSYSFNLDRDRNLVANFEATTWLLTVNSGSGSGNYAAGTVVNISANAAPSGKTFDQWTGDVSGVADANSANTTFTMGSANATITATYKDIPIVNAQTPTISAQPQGATVDIGTPVTLSVSASVTDGGTLSYQWYADDSAISEATGSSYSPPTATAGTTSYYVVITNTNNSVNGATTATVTSDAATVVVNGSGTAIETVDASSVNVYAQNGKLVIKSDSEPIARVEIFNFAGQLLKAIQSGEGNSVEISGLPKQALIVKVILSNGNPVIIRKGLLF